MKMYVKARKIDRETYIFGESAIFGGFTGRNFLVGNVLAGNVWLMLSFSKALNVRPIP